MEALSLQLVHRIPGRMRLALPPAASARAVEAAAACLRQQPGVSAVTANPLTRRLLVLHEPAAALSAFIAPDPDPEPETKPGPAAGAKIARHVPASGTAATGMLREDLQSSLPAGGLLAAALAKNYLLGGAGRALFLDYAAVGATVFSVLRHGGGNFRDRLMHPDTIASILLLVASQPTQLVAGALVMWILNIAEITSSHLQQDTTAAEEGKAPTEAGTGTAGGGSLLNAVLRAATGASNGFAEQVGAFGTLLK